MTTRRDPDRRVRAFIAEGEFELPHRVYDAVRAVVDATGRSGFLSGRRVNGMSTMGKVAVAAAAAVTIGVVGVGILAGEVAGPGATPSRGASPGTPGPPVGQPGTVRTRVSADGVAISLSIPGGWETFGPDYPDYATKSSTGPQGAEAQVLWTAFPAIGSSAVECAYLRGLGGKASVDELAAAVSTVPGTRVTSGPTDVTVGGHRAAYVAFIVEQDVGCDPGFFHTYPSVFGGALWPETYPGDTVRVWIVESLPRLLFFEGKTHAEAGAGLDAEIQAIVDSITFE